MSNENKIYKTKQKENILRYFKNFQDSHITAQEIYDYLNKMGTPVGVTTIYRHLEKLVSEGIIKKYVLDSKKGAYFEYVDNKVNKDIKFHLKCNKCDELYHFKCNELKNLYIHFLEKHNMNIDLSKTVYYGICDKCNKLY